MPLFYLTIVVKVNGTKLQQKTTPNSWSGFEYCKEIKPELAKSQTL